jgi:hypothetical protein
MLSILKGLVVISPSVHAQQKICLLVDVVKLQGFEMTSETAKVAIVVHQWDKFKKNHEKWVELPYREFTLSQLIEKMKEFDFIGSNAALTRWVHPVTGIIHNRVMRLHSSQDDKLWIKARNMAEGDTPFNMLQKMRLDLKNFAI